MYLIQIKHAQIKIPLCSFWTVWQRPLSGIHSIMMEISFFTDAKSFLMSIFEKIAVKKFVSITRMKYFKFCHSSCKNILENFSFHTRFYQKRMEKIKKNLNLHSLKFFFNIWRTWSVTIIILAFYKQFYIPID
jgi:hypothetical protein